ILRVEKSIDLPGGSGLVHEPALGRILVGDGRLATLNEGQAWELTLIDSVDERAGRPAGIRDASIDRLFTLDVMASAGDELITLDNGRHQLTMFYLHEKEIEPVMSWPVFEDGSYPYGSAEMD